MTNQPEETSLGEALKAASDDELIGSYVRLRQERDRINKEAEDRLRPVKGLMVLAETEMLGRLNDRQIDSVKGPGGTAFKQKHNSATIADPAAFKGYVIQNQLWDLVDWRANAPAAVHLAETQQTAIPGLNLSSIFLVRFRAKKGS